VHRLDKGTSGVLVLARDADAARALGAAFEAGAVAKRYPLLVRGWPADEGQIDHPLARDPERAFDRAGHAGRVDALPLPGPLRVAVPGRHAACGVALPRWSTPGPTPGRRHQIRRHFKHIGHPVVGDSTHGKGAHNRAVAAWLGVSRLWLHAASITLPHPDGQQHLTLDAEPGAEWQVLQARQPTMTLMSSASASTTDPHPSAVDLLRRVRSCFDTATAALARACAVDGRLDAAALDRQQVGSYDLAWVSADLLAAETLLSSLGSGSTGVDRRLALVFAAEAVGACLVRLESLYLDQGLDLAPLQALSVSSAWAQLRRDGSGAQALADAGQAVVDARGEIAAVALSESLALAQASFRRVAAEVVAPAAEAIHRQDLTVPESVLQPLREMGVFGLAIPERFGGIAPDDRDDTLMMVAVTEALSEASLGAAGSLITRPEILSRALLAGGSDAQKRHWLPKIAAGEPLCAIAITEPDHGSDVAGLTFKGTRVPGGWRLDGAKTWCTFAGKAGLLMVVTRTDPDRSLGHRGLSLMLVEKPASEGHAFDHRQPDGGRLQGRSIPTIGYRGMHSFDLSFENFFVPDSHVIGEAARPGARLLPDDDGHGRRAHADRRPFLRCDVGGPARGAGLYRRPARVRRAAAGLPADAGQAGAHGRAPGRMPPADLCGGACAGRRWRPGRSQPGQAAGLPLGRDRHPRSAATARRHGLRRGNPGQPLLRGCTRAVDLRRRRGDIGVEGDCTGPAGGRVGRWGLTGGSTSAWVGQHDRSQAACPLIRRPGPRWPARQPPDCS
jgi:alkylation response protein AidB-like acyl-CoA dehydrogenase